MFAAENLRPFLANKITSGYSETKCCKSRMCRTEMVEMRHWECAYCGPVSVHVRATVSGQLLTGPNCCKVTD